MKTILFWITVVYSIFTILWGGADWIADWIAPMVVAMISMWVFICKTFTFQDWKNIGSDCRDTEI